MLETNNYIIVQNPFNFKIIDKIKKLNVSEISVVLDKCYNYKPHLKRVDRIEVLEKVKKSLTSNKNKFAQLISSESGLSLNDTLGEVDRSLEALKSAISTLYFDDGKSFSCDISHTKNQRKIYTQREPLEGVILGITPFNHPLHQVMQKLIPSIITNNRIIIKPSYKTPLTALALYELFREAELPEEMFQVIICDAEDLFKKFIEDSRLDLISFTGSTFVGKKIAQKVGFKRLVLELGGNDPLIIMEDADIELAVKLAVTGSFKNSGQRCTAVKRILVHKEVSNTFINKFIQATATYSYGDPLDLTNQMGTVIDEEAAQNIKNKVNLALKEGAQLIYGNIKEFALYSPTILINIHRDMVLVREETFGPIAPIINFSSLEEAIELANYTTYGLSSGVCTNNFKYIRRFVKELKVGNININETPGDRIELAPFGGIKESGLGIKEGISEAIKVFTNLKTYSLPWG